METMSQQQLTDRSNKPTTTNPKSSTKQIIKEKQSDNKLSEYGTSHR